MQLMDQHRTHHFKPNRKKKQKSSKEEAEMEETQTQTRPDYNHTPCHRSANYALAYAGAHGTGWRRRTRTQ